MSKIIEIYTDWSCLWNPWNGWWAYILRYENNIKQNYWWIKYTTNNQMELLAVISALKENKEFIKNKKINIYTDSNYVKMWISQWIKKWKQNNWKTSNKQDIKNKNFWEELDNLTENLDINWYWVRGHAENNYNNMVDKIAKQSAKWINLF